MVPKHSVSLPVTGSLTGSTVRSHTIGYPLVKTVGLSKLEHSTNEVGRGAVFQICSRTLYSERSFGGYSDKSGSSMNAFGIHNYVEKRFIKLVIQ